MLVGVWVWEEQGVCDEQMYVRMSTSWYEEKRFIIC